MAGKTATLNELMGSSGSKKEGRKLTMDDVKDLLGERMPSMEFSPVGRIRLINALKGRFGTGFRNLPGISDIIKDFDQQAKFQVEVERMKQIRGKSG